MKIPNFKLKNKTKLSIEVTFYVICIVLVILLNDSGNIYFRMLPLLFILGGVGNIIFGRPVMTTIFGMITSLCIVYIKERVGFVENIFIASCTGLNIAIGEILGNQVMKSYHALKKKNAKKRIRKEYIYVILLLLIIVGIQEYTNGNIIKYENHHALVNTYLKETYPNEQFKLISSQYSFGKNSRYLFVYKNVQTQENYPITIYTQKGYTIYDQYQHDLMLQEAKEATKALNNYLKKQNLDNVYVSFFLECKYTEVGDLTLVLNESVEEVTEERKIEFSKKVANFLEDIQSFRRYEQINRVDIMLKDKINSSNTVLTNIDMELYHENKETQALTNEEYILQALQIEYMDS